MTTRNGDAYNYNAQGKLKEIVTSGGDRFEYAYDHAGNRIKKSLLNQNTTTYSFGNLYEVYRAPGQPEKHTMYVVGVEGDIVAQYSRSDASLFTSIATNDWLVNPFCSDVNLDCGTYWKNRVGFNFISLLAESNVYTDGDGQLKKGHRAIPWILILGTLFIIVHRTRKSVEQDVSELQNTASDLFGITILPNVSNYLHKQFPRYATSVLLVVFTFTSTAGCFPLLMGAGEGESGTPVWLLGISGGIPAETPSVSNDTASSGGSGSTSSHGHINGMYFYHPDHLGSITMITDGNGNVLAGGERGGKSHITYKPYGEILRTDSYGPDISKFKYTGQEEDKESGLYYYKARYYDASLGRFISNDGMVFPGKEQGMNRQMYVEGNPIAWRDVSGNSTNYVHMFNQIVSHSLGGRHKLDGSRVRSLGKTIDHSARSLARGMDYAGRKAGRGADGGARSLISGGKYSRNKGNDIDNLLGSGKFFQSLQKSDVSNWFSKQYNDLRKKPFWNSADRQSKKAEDRLEQRNIICAAVFADNLAQRNVCIQASFKQWQNEDDRINLDQTIGSGDTGNSEMIIISIAIACVFPDKSEAGKSTFCKSDPNNPDNRPQATGTN